ncbi:MAG: type II secretion system protein GspK [Pseudomonadota bacterium]|uniref:general secretion pathway protein GspK n=1 Tax=Gallaecimonas pentaromativorans TaxID=584787 RepID=UPI00067F2480|nr:type II secretion system protein GspK [Gallaecimonas pentaromativorans]MED5526790.1 type II secretion system protein GspK [Pseudomonadota bacterium]
MVRPFPCTAARAGGIALVAVLWLLVLLTLMASTVALSSRSGAQVQYRLEQATANLWRAKGAVSLAIISLNTAQDQSPWLADGSPYQVQFDQQPMAVAVFDERGKIDLNAAPPTLLDGLLRQAGVGDSERTALVDAILDWRDEDDLQRLDGAESAQYQAAGLDGPANAPFNSINELRQVLGMTDALVEALRPALTLYSHRATVLPQLAPRQVLLAMPGADALLVDDYIRQRRQLHDSGLPIPAPTWWPAEQATPGFGRYYTVQARLPLGDGQEALFSALLQRQQGDPARPFRVLSLGPGLLPDIDTGGAHD